MTSSHHVLLVNPPYSPTKKRIHHVQNYPLGVLAVGSALETEGYRVRVVDCVYTDAYNDLIAAEARGALFVGFSVMTNQVACALETAALLRRQAPGIPLVWGGIHPTLEPEATAQSDFCDIAVIGEADETIVALARCLERGEDLASAPGILFKRQGAIVRTPPAPIIQNLDTLPRINYELVNIENYLDMDVDKKFGFFPDEPGSVRRLTLQSARGCPYRCHFCINSIIRGDAAGHHRYRAYSVDRLMDDIRFYKSRYSINFLSFGDDLFFAHHTRSREIVDRLLKESLDIKWYANVRADFFRDNYINKEFLGRMKHAGCIRLALGIESGSSRILEYLNKQLTPPDAIRAARWSQEAGLVAGYSFMTGLPGETEEDIYRTLCLIFILGKLHPLGYIIGPQLYRPYPGSKLFEDCVRLGWRRPASLADWSGDLELSGNFAIEKMAWVRNPRLVAEAQAFSARLADGSAAAYLQERCPALLREYQAMAEPEIEQR